MPHLALLPPSSITFVLVPLGCLPLSRFVLTFSARLLFSVAGTISLLHSFLNTLYFYKIARLRPAAIAIDNFIVLCDIDYLHSLTGILYVEFLLMFLSHCILYVEFIIMHSWQNKTWIYQLAFNNLHSLTCIYQIVFTKLNS